MLAIEDAERLMGFPPGYTQPCFPLRRPNERMPVFDVDLQTFRRFSLLGLACSVPQSRWLGEQLKSPYQSKYVYDVLSTPFEKACPGPATGDRTIKAWPLAAYNMLAMSPDEPKWTGRRRAPSEISEFPLIRGFTPLGVFLEHSKNRPVRYELREGYLRRLELSHEDIDKTVLAALDVKRFKDDSSILPKKSKVVDILEGADDEDLQLETEYHCSDTDDDAEVATTAEHKEKR